MDQTGAIEAGTVERLVLWAKDHRFRGSIDIRGAHTATLYFSAGFIAHIDSGEQEPPTSDADTKERVQARLGQRLSSLLTFGDGSYVIRRSEELPPEARWLFGPQGLLDIARSAATTAGPPRWADRQVRLDDQHLDGEVRLSEDTFRLVVALTRSMRGRTLQGELGWASERLDRAIDELAGHRLLVVSPQIDDGAGRPEAAEHTGAEADGAISPAAVVDLRPDERRRAIDQHPAVTADPGPSLARRPPPKPASDDVPARPPTTTASAAAMTTTDDEAAAPPPGGRTRASALRRLIQNLR